jgi:hypothetical protein
VRVVPRPSAERAATAVGRPAPAGEIFPAGPDACIPAPMKTLTELSGTTLRQAAAAIAAAKRSLPSEEPPATVPAVVVSLPSEVSATPGGGEAAPPEGGVAPVVGEQVPATGATAATQPSPPPPPPRPAEETESEEVKALFDAAVAAATGLSGDRLARLRDAVKAVGRQIDDVRLVRVFGPEEPVPGAKMVGGFQYLVDVAPASMRQDPGSQKKERGRGGGGGGRGGGSGGGGKGAPTSGGFSMDSLKEDRKGQRSGPGGRGRPGGGRPGGGTPGGGAPR